MSQLWQALSGYKTYIGAVITVAYAGYQYFVAGDMPQAEAVKMIEGALFACTIRHGMATSIAQFITSLKDGAATPPTLPKTFGQSPPSPPQGGTGTYTSKTLSILAALGIGLLSLQACGAAPMTASAQPQTPKETLVALEVSYTSALDTANDLIAQKIIIGHGVSDIIAADSFASAALDNADAMVLLASQEPTPANKDNAAKALQIAQGAVASLVTILQQQQGSK